VSVAEFHGLERAAGEAEEAAGRAGLVIVFWWGIIDVAAEGRGDWRVCILLVIGLAGAPGNRAGDSGVGVSRMFSFARSDRARRVAAIVGWTLCHLHASIIHC
jgi:hypothetical protein